MIYDLSTDEVKSRFQSIEQLDCQVSPQAPCVHINAANGRPKRCTVVSDTGVLHRITHLECQNLCIEWNNNEEARNALDGRLPCPAYETNVTGPLVGTGTDRGICTLIKAFGQESCPNSFGAMYWLLQPSSPNANEAYTAGDIGRITGPTETTMNCNRIFPRNVFSTCPTVSECTMA